MVTKLLKFSQQASQEPFWLPMRLLGRETQGRDFNRMVHVARRSSYQRKVIEQSLDLMHLLEGCVKIGVSCMLLMGIENRDRYQLKV